MLQSPRRSKSRRPESAMTQSFVRVTHLSEVDHKRPTYIAVGSFDGVHLGHQALLRDMVARARQDGARAAALTFFPHPRRVLQTLPPRFYLTTLDDRVHLLAEQGKNAECRQIDVSLHQVLVPPELTRRWLVQLRKDHPLLLVLHQTNNALEGESCMNHVPRRVVAGWWADPSLREDNATAAQSKAPCQDTRSQRDARPTCGVPQQLDDRPPTGEEPAHESKIS